MTPFTAALICASLSFGPAAPTPMNQVEVDVSELVADPQSWDQHRVVITGELVGDYSQRDEGVWVQVNDDEFVGSPIAAGGRPAGTNVAIGALIPSEELTEVDGPPGRYGTTGPVVRLEGIYLHSDPVRQGESYLAVEEVTTLIASRSHSMPPPDLWLVVGPTLLVAAGIIVYSTRRRQGRPDKRSTMPSI